MTIWQHTISARLHARFHATVHPAHFVRSMAIHLKGTQASVHLDLIRGLAAIEVLLFHAWGQLFLPIEESGRQPLFARILRQIVSYGHEGVVVFFVLSGLLISASVIQDVRTGRWSWRRYAVARAS